MIIFDPITFRQALIDDSRLTDDQQELFKTLGGLTKEIMELVRQRDIVWLKILAESGMTMKDLIDKLRVK